MKKRPSPIHHHLDRAPMALAYNRHGKAILYCLASLLIAGCSLSSLIKTDAPAKTGKTGAPVRLAGGDKTPLPQKTAPPKKNASSPDAGYPRGKSLQDIVQKMQQMEKNNRDALTELHRRLAAHEEELRLLQGNIEVLQHDNKGMKQWLTLMGKPQNMEAPPPQALPNQDGSRPPAQDDSQGEDTEKTQSLPQALPQGAAQAGTPQAIGVVVAASPGAVAVQAAAKPDDEETPQKLYDAAFALLKSGQYDASRESFNRFLEKFPNDALSDNAQYWIGELYSAQKRYRKALMAFNQVLVRWPTSAKVPASLLKMGFAFYELGDLDNAYKSLSQLVTVHPNSPAVAMAKKRLQDIARRRDIARRTGMKAITKKESQGNPVSTVGGNSGRTTRINRVMGGE